MEQTIEDILKDEMKTAKMFGVMNNSSELRDCMCDCHNPIARISWDDGNLITIVSYATGITIIKVDELFELTSISLSIDDSIPNLKEALANHEEGE